MKKESFCSYKKHYDGNGIGFPYDVTILKIIVTETDILIISSQPLLQQVDFIFQTFQTKLINL